MRTVLLSKESVLSVLDLVTCNWMVQYIHEVYTNT